MQRDLVIEELALISTACDEFFRYVDVSGNVRLWLQYVLSLMPAPATPASSARLHLISSLYKVSYDTSLFAWSKPDSIAQMLNMCRSGAAYSSTSKASRLAESLNWNNEGDAQISKKCTRSMRTRLRQQPNLAALVGHSHQGVCRLLEAAKKMAASGP